MLAGLLQVMLLLVDADAIMSVVDAAVPFASGVPPLAAALAVVAVDAVLVGVVRMRRRTGRRVPR